jgi:histidine ammonia-lyase
MPANFLINPGPLDFKQLLELTNHPSKLELSPESLRLIENCRQYLDRRMANSTEPIYGINTGFGSLCNIRISSDDLSQLQENLVKSHACGTGDEVKLPVVKLMLLLKIHALSLGKSGVQVSTVQRLIDFYNHDVMPVIYELGSLGASGDLAPLAHLVLPLIGLGEVNINGKRYSSAVLKEMFGWEPLVLQSKEGLALLNGTQFMSAHGVHVVMKALKLLRLADITGAMSLEAYNGRIDPFLAPIHTARPHAGQIETAVNLRKLLEGSSLITKTSKAIQDPYSFRCIPQVHGAVKDTVKYVSGIVLTEINSVTDNPTIFPEEDLILSGGNFHGEPLAFALDFISIALAELGNIAERRLYRLIAGQRGLPEFLVANPGLNSGFMIPQYAAASIVSQNKQLCTPCSVDSITSSNEQEDHVSMGANAATKALRVVNNLERILAIELMASAQALEFRRPGKTSLYLEDILAEYRKSVPFVADDTVLYELIATSVNFIRKHNFEIPA